MAPKPAAKIVTPDITPPAEAAFAITATQPTRLPRTLKYGDTFIALDGRGDIGAPEGESAGLFHEDTRHLSRLELLVNGAPPLLLGANLRDDNTAFIVDLTNPDIKAGDRVVIEKDRVHILRTMFLWRGTAYQRLGVRNYGESAIDLRITLAFENDFADLFEVRGMHREARGTASAKLSGKDRVQLIYHGLDHKVRRTALVFDPAPDQLTTARAVYDLHLEPGESQPLFLAISCDQKETHPQPFLRGLIKARREMREQARERTAVETSNGRFNEILCRSAADLSMLMTNTPQGRYPYAGIPWYSTTFGRDGLITALQMLWWSPEVARGVLRRLAHYQAKTVDPLADAQPGKILHEMRGGEMAALREVPFGLYYGSVDATPLFVLLAGLYTERTGDIGTFVELWPNIEAALAWIDGPADPDGDGFVEYLRATEQGLANQGWKDSHDAIFHADGRLAEGAIALVEVQGYVYAAKWLAARCAKRIGLDAVAKKLANEAEQLADRFEETFWCPEIGTYALALDGNKKRCEVRTSNAGQVLFTGIASVQRAAHIAKELLQPNFFTGWGIRTVAQGEARFNPMSYHNGSVWPHDNALIALGLARYDQKRAIDTLFEGLFNTAVYMEHRRLPELFCGFRQKRGHGPTLYPVACSPQAWASVTPFTLLEASLGLEFDPFNGEIRLRNPRLPEFLDEVILRGLRLGSASVDLRVRRHGDTVSLDTPRISGDIRVSIVFSS
ncbi:MAG TPA: amylo-alpha-1,6-glucosidase [Xanthobacteraceae bacterium]|jgi:glycogen debranching enzyme|nr:amylo-alpha-1,6-glucosidase [Xanthobacteraceae bacterium]